MFNSILVFDSQQWSTQMEWYLILNCQRLAQ